MRRLRVNVLANVAGTGSLAFVQFACAPLYIRFLGPEAYGLIGFFLTLQASLRVLDLGLTPTINRELARLAADGTGVDEVRDLVRTVELGYWAVGIAIGAVICFAAGWIATRWINVASLPIAEVQRAVLLMGLTVAVQWPTALYQGGLQGLERQVPLNAIRIAAAVLGGGGSVFVLWSVSRTITAFFLCQLAAAAFQVILITVVLWRSVPRGTRPTVPSVRSLRGVLRFAGGMMGIAVSGMILTQIDKVVLSKILPLAAFGYYTLASMLASGLQLFINPVFAAVFPRLSALAARGNERAIGDLYHEGTQLMVILVLPLALVVALFAPEVLRLWTGDAALARDAAPIVLFLIGGTAINGIMFLPYALQLAYGWTKISLLITSGMCIALAPAVYVMAIHFGAAGAASVWLVLNVLNLAIAVPLTHRRLLVRQACEWLRLDVGAPLAAAAVVSCAMRWLLPFPAGRVAGFADLMLVFLAAATAAAIFAPRIRVRIVHTIEGIAGCS